MKVKKARILSKIIVLLILISFLFILFKSNSIVMRNNFGDYEFYETLKGYSTFERDYEDKFNNSGAYVIKSEYNNDAMISKKIQVEKNTPYKLSCYIKTEGVVPDQSMKGIGAMLSIVGDTQTSKVLTGDTEYTYVELLFNSKNREEIEIGGRLGGNLGKAKGVAKFCDFTLEKGEFTQRTNVWDVAYFIFPNTDATVNNVTVKTSMSEQELADLNDTIQRFEKSAPELSNGKLNIQTHIYYIDSPIESLTYDDEFGYHIESYDIDSQIRAFVEENEFDHIFVACKLGAVNDRFSNIADWLGLGGMNYNGIGFSNLRLPEDDKSIYYKYSDNFNTYPEEIIMHEFLHSFEKVADEFGYTIPQIHDYEKYGYKDEKLIGTKTFFYDYLNCQIVVQDTNIGVPEELYYLKPVNKACFQKSKILKDFKEPINLIETAKYLILRLKRILNFN